MSPSEIFQIFVVALVGILPLLVVIIVWKENRSNHRVSPQDAKVPRLWVVIENPGKDICIGETDFPRPPPLIATVV